MSLTFGRRTLRLSPDMKDYANVSGRRSFGSFKFHRRMRFGAVLTIQRPGVFLSRPVFRRLHFECARN